MTRDLPREEQEVWTLGGQEAAVVLRRHTAVVIAAPDGRQAAHVALGIAEASARLRHVLIADLCGTPTLESLADNDPHGVSDAFDFGLSLERLARPNPTMENVTFMRVGTNPNLGALVFRSRRWRALSEKLLERDALLLLVADIKAQGLADLVAQLDGVILADADMIPDAPNANVLGRISPVHRPLLADTGSHWGWTIAAAVAFALAGIGALGYGFYSGYLELPWRAEKVPVVAAAPPTPKPIVPARATPANPADSARAARFAVEVLSANTQAGANFTLRRNMSFIPAATVASVPVGVDRAIWYKVVGGAFTERSGADSLLALLRKSKIVPDSAGAVIETPLALLLDTIPSQGGIVEKVQVTVDSLSKRGFPVYALMQEDGSARLYAGAFARAEEAETLASEMKSAGLASQLVYRTGRTR